MDIEPMDTLRALVALRALAHAHRLAAYRALVQAGPEGLSVGELRDALALAPATLTSHLNQLRGAGLVTDEREGRVIRVRAEYPAMNALVGFLTENCCGGDAARCAPSGKQAASRVSRPADKNVVRA